MSQANIKMDCRAGCGACCTAISISSPIPGMPAGKPAGVRCPHLLNGLCLLFGKPDRPAVCGSFQAEPAVCGANARQAYYSIRRLERQTAPASVR